MSPSVTWGMEKKLSGFTHRSNAVLNQENVSSFNEQDEILKNKLSPQQHTTNQTSTIIEEPKEPTRAISADDIAYNVLNNSNNFKASLKNLQNLKENQYLDIREEDSDDRTVTPPPESPNKQKLRDDQNLQEQFDISIKGLNGYLDNQTKQRTSSRANTPDQ